MLVVICDSLAKPLDGLLLMDKAIHHNLTLFGRQRESTDVGIATMTGRESDDDMTQSFVLRNQRDEALEGVFAIVYNAFTATPMQDWGAGN